MPLFKRKHNFAVKVEGVSLPEAVRQITRETKLALETKQQMHQALKTGGIKDSEVKSLMSGQKKLSESELKKMGDILIKGKVQGLGKFASGVSLINSYRRLKEKQQARFYFFRQQREDEERAVGTSEKIVAIGERQKPAASALEKKEAVTSAFGRETKPLPPAGSLPGPSAPPDRPRINLPF